MEAAEFESLRERVRGTNISEDTLLATDYLNHFNELVMVMEMVPDFPDCLEEAKAWQPKSYTEHFAGSAFSDKDLAIEAYAHVPPNFRKPFETTIEQINQAIAVSVARLEKLVAEGNPEKLRLTATDASRSIQRLLDVASAIIHGSEITMDQAEIDHLLGD